MVKRIFSNVSPSTRWTLEKVKKRLEEKRKKVKHLPLRGVIGKQKRTLECLKTTVYSLLDRYLNRDLPEASHEKGIVLLLTDIAEDKRKLKDRYKRALGPYPKEMKDKLERVKERITSQIKGRLYFSPSSKTEVPKSDRMPLIRYLQGKARAEQLLYFGFSGLYLIKEYVLSSIHSGTKNKGKKVRKAMKEKKKLKKELKELLQKIKLEKHILLSLVKAEKREEETTFTMKEDDAWKEEEF